MYKKLALLSALVTIGSALDVQAVPCGVSGTLNVGILSGAANLPYSDYDTTLHVPFGFDVDLVAAIAKVLGYNVNFIFVASQAAAETDLTAGTLDVYANSATELDTGTLGSYGAVVTDISQITNDATDPIYRGYLFSQQCCALMYQFEAALNQLIGNGTYADLLQKQREDPRQSFKGDYGQFNTTINPFGILVSPLIFNSSMAGTITQGTAATVTGSTGCRTQRVGLPVSNCVSQFVIFNTPNCYTFTGSATGVGPVSGTGCTTF